MKNLFTFFFVAATMLTTVGATVQNQAGQQNMMRFDHEQMIKQVDSKKSTQTRSVSLKSGSISYTEIDYLTFILTDGTPKQDSLTVTDNSIDVWGSSSTGIGYSFTAQAGKAYKITCTFTTKQVFDFMWAGVYLLKDGTLQGNYYDDILNDRIYSYGFNQTEVTASGYHIAVANGEVRMLIYDNGSNDLNYTITIEEVNIPPYTILDYTSLTLGDTVQGSFSKQDNMFIDWNGASVPGKGHLFTPKAGKKYKIICTYETPKRVYIYPYLFILTGGGLQGNYNDVLGEYNDNYCWTPELMLTAHFTSDDGSEIRLLLSNRDVCLGLGESNLINYTITIKEVVEVDRTHAFEMNSRLGMGMNLGNMFDAPSIGAWGVQPDAEYFSDIKSKGFSSIRLPVRWSAHAKETFPYIIDKEFMDTIQWAVDLALENELPVVINIHHYEEMMGNPTAHKERFLALWDQISTQFQHYTNSLYFEILNEPNGNLTPILWNVYLEEGLAKIRETNPDRMVIIGTANWGGMEALPQLQLPDDPNIILTVHYYDPKEFTLQGDNNNPITGAMWNGTTAQNNAMKNDMNSIKRYSEVNNVPVYIGEFGVTENTDEASRLRWVKQLRNLFEEHGFSSAYWRYSADFGVYNQNLNCYHPEMIKILTGFDGEMCDCSIFGDLIVKNSTFDRNTNPWQFYSQGGANAKVSAVNGEARIEIVKNGTAAWNIQFLYTPISLKKGYTYTLTFDAHASLPTTIETMINRNNAALNYPLVHKTDNDSSKLVIDLITEKKTFSLTFKYEGEGINDARIAFDCGLTNAQYIYFDNVYLHETAPSSNSEIVLPKCMVKIGENRFEVEGNSIEMITIYDVSGRVCYRKTYPRVGSVEIGNAYLPSGVSFVQVQTDAKNTVVKNLMRK